VFSVTLVGASELTARLDEMPAVVRALLEARVSALAIQLQALVEEKLSGELLQVRSGALRRSIQEEVTVSATSVYGRVFSAGDVKYAAIQEFGGVTSPHDIEPSKAEALHFFAGGREVFAKVVHHPGSRIEGKHYLTGSLEEMAPEIAAEMKAAVIAGLQQSVLGA
jgi:hypothetical protein